jgi:hypothetical protein
LGRARGQPAAYASAIALIAEFFFAGSVTLHSIIASHAFVVRDIDCNLNLP